MTETKIHAKLENLLIDAFETEPFSLAILHNTLAVIKPDLMAISFRDFPVLALTGKPGSGKTTIARVCSAENTKEYSFTDKPSSVKKELAGLSDGYVLLDDLADYGSSYSKQKAQTFLDEIVRSSYSGKLPLVMITAEDQALTRMILSCRERLLEISVNGILDNEEIISILDYLMRNKYILNKIITGLSEWYKSNGSRYNYADMLRIFREEHKEQKPRSISIFFAYHASMHVFCDYVNEVYQVTISKKKIKDSYMKAWKKRTFNTIDRTQLVQELFQALISHNAFSPIKPKLSECKTFCSGCCPDYNNKGRDFCDPEYCNSYSKGYYYDPRDLILDNDSNTVILIENPQYLYYYPKYCDSHSPLMIIRDDALLTLMNTELHSLCCEHDIRLLPFGQKELHQKLFELNMCMYHYISNEHKTYTFKYSSLFNDTSANNTSVMVIRLTARQFQEFKNPKSNGYRMFIDKRLYTGFCTQLKNMGRTIHGMLGIIGNS